MGEGRREGLEQPSGQRPTRLLSATQLLKDKKRGSGGREPRLGAGGWALAAAPGPTEGDRRHTAGSGLQQGVKEVAVTAGMSSTSLKQLSFRVWGKLCSRIWYRVDVFHRAKLTRSWWASRLSTVMLGSHRLPAQGAEAWSEQRACACCVCMCTQLSSPGRAPSHSYLSSHRAWPPSSWGPHSLPTQKSETVEPLPWDIC